MSHSTASPDAVSSSLVSNDLSRRGSLYTGMDFPKDDEGRVHHLSLRQGEVAQRIVSVGDPTRAAALAAHFDEPYVEERVGKETKRYDSHRPGAFTTFTGKFQGVDVSVIATGMGCPNMDFVVRETRGIVEGPMAIVRFGSCGIIDPETKPGSVCVTSGSTMVTRNPDAWDEEAEGLAKYRFSRPISSHKGLSDMLSECLMSSIGEDRVCGGMNATADSFYFSQGRASNDFDDGNATLVEDMRLNPNKIITCEMETFHLLDLARCAKRWPMAASAAVICVASRSSGQVMETSAIRELESKGGRAILEAITRLDIDKL